MSVRRTRPILKRVFLDDVEIQLLKNNMIKFGMRKFSTYARRVLLYPTTPVIQVDTHNVQLLVQELKRIGNNINQLAKLANQTKSVDEKMFSELDEQVQDLQDTLAENFRLQLKEIEEKYGGH